MILEKILLHIISKNDLKLFEVKDEFVGEILEIWAGIHFQRNLKSFEDFAEQDIWIRNSLIMTEKQTS